MNEFLKVADAILICYGCVLAVLCVRAIQGRIPKQYYSKYPKELIHRSQLPFAEKWRESVEGTDLPTFTRAKTRRNVFGLAAMGFFCVLPWYLLAQSVVNCTRACGGR